MASIAHCVSFFVRTTSVLCHFRSLAFWRGMMSTRHFLRIVVINLALLLHKESSAAIVTFFDGDFLESEYIVKHIGPSTSTATTESADGNPDGWRHISLSVEPGQSVNSIQLWKKAVYTPLVHGPIQSMRFTIDGRFVSATVEGATQVPFGLAIQQGNLPICQQPVEICTVNRGFTDSSAWTTFTYTDAVVEAVDIDWESGREIMFGFYDSVSAIFPKAEPFTIDAGYDNFEVRLVVDCVPGDTNADRKVDLDDLVNVRNHFGDGAQLGPPVFGEACGYDGVVDLNDLNLVRNNFGVVAPASVPEAPTWRLATIAFAAIALSLRPARQRRFTPSPVPSPPTPHTSTPES